MIPFGIGHLMAESRLKLTDEQLSAEYRKDFEDVLIVDTYDADGRPIEDMRDVYVKYRG